MKWGMGMDDRDNFAVMELGAERDACDVSANSGTNGRST